MKCSFSTAIVCLYCTHFLREANALASNKPERNTLISIDYSNRRKFLMRNGLNVLTTTGILVPLVVNAEDDKPLPSDSESVVSTQDRRGKPYAPLEALLPVTRLKIWVDKIHALSCDLSSTKDQNQRYEILQEINSVLSERPQLFYSEKLVKRSRHSTAQLTTNVSTANKDEYQLNRKGLNIGDRLIATFNQVGVERQWGIIQYAESKREESNEMRASFNFYTRQLTFGDNYVLNVPKEERKKMIRNDELPSLTSVITSDLDRRDLYRNQFLTAIEDARAEVYYQTKQNIEDLDVLDAIGLVNEAFVAIENWFDMIAPEDVNEALVAVR